MQFRLPHPWDPQYALPANVVAEPPRFGTITTAYTPRGTYDWPEEEAPPWAPEYAYPPYLDAEIPGAGVYRTKPLPRRHVDALVPNYLSGVGFDDLDERTTMRTSPEMNIKAGEQWLAAAARRYGTSFGTLGDYPHTGSPPPARLANDAIGQFGRDAARGILARLGPVPAEERKTALRTLLDYVEPGLWKRVTDKANEYQKAGAPPDEALERALASQLSFGLLQQILRAGQTRGVQRQTLLGLGVYHGTLPGTPRGQRRRALGQTEVFRTRRVPFRRRRALGATDALLQRVGGTGVTSSGAARAGERVVTVTVNADGSIDYKGLTGAVRHFTQEEWSTLLASRLPEISRTVDPSTGAVTITFMGARGESRITRSAEEVAESDARQDFRESILGAPPGTYEYVWEMKSPILGDGTDGNPFRLGFSILDPRTKKVLFLGATWAGPRAAAIMKAPAIKAAYADAIRKASGDDLAKIKTGERAFSKFKVPEDPDGRQWKVYYNANKETRSGRGEFRLKREKPKKGIWDAVKGAGAFLIDVTLATMTGGLSLVVAPVSEAGKAVRDAAGQALDKVGEFVGDAASFLGDKVCDVIGTEAGQLAAGVGAAAAGQPPQVGLIGAQVGAGLCAGSGGEFFAPPPPPTFFEQYGTLLLLGGAGLAAYFVLRKKG
jgi:hypothetical protein